MKTLGLKMVMLFFLMVGGTAVMAQQQYNQDVPGDDFSLEGALDLFKRSTTPEEFERKLNSPESKVNNLDLNGDGEIDYIRVIDRNQGNVHAFILQAVLSSNESQDVAVIELEKLANGKAVLQITGDEDVYGVETIIEPTEEVRVMAGASTARSVVNVWAWPSVQYVYSPYYSAWESPWHWYYRPFWWSSWRPVTYYEYYSYWYPYRTYYAPCYTHRVAYAQTVYRPYRTHSPVYYRRNETRIVHYRSNYSLERKRYDYDQNHNRRTSYSDDRTSHNRNDSDNRHDYKSADRTPVTRERSGSNNEWNKHENDSHERDRSTVNTPVQRERKESFESKPERSQHVYTNRSEREKPVVAERSAPRSERSTTIHMDRSSQQREVRSVDKPDRGRSGGGEVRSSGNGNRGGNGNDRSHGNGKGKKN